MPNYSGVWTLQQQYQSRGQNIWPSIPGAPTSPVATAGDTLASVAFVAPSNSGYPAITSYRVTSTPGGIIGTGATSPVTVSGLTNGTAYTFTVAAQNAAGYGPASVASNSVTPAVPNYIEETFSTYLYTGTGTTQTITNNINLSGQGGLLWVKSRSGAYNNLLLDTARGDFALLSNLTTAQSAFDWTANSTGFSTVANSVAINNSGSTYVSWTFRKQPKFFDVVTYTGNGVAGRTVAHNLEAVPGCIIIKCTSAVADWRVYHRSNANTQYLTLNTNSDTLTGATIWNSTTPTSTVFSVGTDSTVNASGSSYVAYLFAHDAGGFGLTGSENVVSCGTYTGNGSATGPIVTLGYEPQWLLIKRADSPADWYTVDNMRGLSVVQTSTRELIPNNANAENADYAGTGFPVAPLSTGFQLSTSVNGSVNANGAKYIYIAIRRGPMKVPTLGTSVFAPVAYTGNGAARTIDTSQPYLDSYIVNRRTTSADNHNWLSRLTGSNALQTNLTLAEGSIGSIAWDSQDLSFTGTNYNTNASAINYIAWTFARAPGFFDEVCYTGTGVSRTVAHNLAAVPELMIVKNRVNARNWRVYVAPLGAASSLNLNTDAADGGLGVALWNSTAPTASVFSLGTDSSVNASADTYVAYLFATAAGVSKVGSYTGTGALQTVACGFTSGARFVLIKRTDSTGDWYVWDSARGITSGNDPYLLLNSTAAEVTSTNYVDTDTTGFKVTATAPAGLNAVGGTYIFLAIA